MAAAFARTLKANPDIDRVDLYALLTQYSNASAALAARDYSERRVAAGIRSQFTVPQAATPTPEHFANTLNWVYADPAAMEERLQAAMTRLAAQSGRETTLQAVKQDRKARAWARETRGACCYFCAMLASRGAVYRDELTAGKDANEKFTGDGAFKFHNNCHCVAVPVFGVYEMAANARQWAADWADLKKKHGGVSLSLWRDHFESATTNDLQPAGI